MIISKALEEKNYSLSHIEINALESGVMKIGDFKRDEKRFEAEMAAAGLTLIEKIKMGPTDIDDVGGVYVYAFKKN